MVNHCGGPRHVIRNMSGVNVYTSRSSKGRKEDAKSARLELIIKIGDSSEPRHVQADRLFLAGIYSEIIKDFEKAREYYLRVKQICPEYNPEERMLNNESTDPLHDYKLDMVNREPLVKDAKKRYFSATPTID